MPQPGRRGWPVAVPVRQSLAEAIRLADAGAPIPDDLVNEKGLDDDHWQTWFDCYAGWEDVTVELCPLGDRRAARTLVVYGDSQAGMLLPALDLIGATRACGSSAWSSSAARPTRSTSGPSASGMSPATTSGIGPGPDPGVGARRAGARRAGDVGDRHHDGAPDQQAWSTGVETTLDEVVAEAGTWSSSPASARSRSGRRTA